MKLFSVVFASTLIGFAAVADVIKTYQGKSSLPPHTCELSIKTSDDGQIIGYLLKGPGEMWMNFGVCENTCVYPDLDSNMIEPADFKRYGFRVIYARTYPQITLVSRFVKEADIIFISRQLEIDLNESEAPDEVRYTESTEVSTWPTTQTRISCDHLQEVKQVTR